MGKEEAQPHERGAGSDDSVAPRGGPPFLVDSVDQVDGRGGIAVPGYTASRYELLVLLKHWAKIQLDTRFDGFLDDHWCSRDQYQHVFASDRITQIVEALADEESVCAAIKKMEEAYVKENDGLAWKVFTQKASADEKRQFRRVQHKRLSGEPGALEEWVKTVFLRPFEQSGPPASE